MYTGVLIFNSSQFNFFENYICPWDSAQADTVYSYRIAYPNQWLVDYYNTTNTNYQLNPTVMNDTHTISFTSNASNWYYMVDCGVQSIPGRESPPFPRSARYCQGLASANVTVNNIMDMYCPQLGINVSTLSAPTNVSERIIAGQRPYIWEFLSLDFSILLAGSTRFKHVPFMALL